MKRSALLALVATMLIATLTFAFVGCDKPQTPARFVHTDGALILDENDEPLGLMGTNFGGWLVQEEWLVPTEVDGDYGQIDMLLELANRFGKDKMKELVDIYEDNWVTEVDFANVKALGMNCVRVPFTYMTLYDAVTLDEQTQTYVRTPFADLKLRDDAFARLDWAVEMGKKYGLYIILDLHGAVGSQSGNDHTGDIAFPNGGQLWLDNEIGEACRAKTKELWVEVADHYKNEPAVALYDLMNEPGIKDANGTQSTRNAKVWDYFDELYDAIRAVDPYHAISMESCWESGGLPSLDEYGWENVVYQYHHYNWVSATGLLNSTFYGFKQLDMELADQNVPIFVGEFNVWGDDQRRAGLTQTEWMAWDGVMEFYTGMGWHFTTWNFKHAANYSSWGLYNRNDDTLSRQADYKNDTFEQIAECWRAGNSSGYHENTDLTSCIKPHLDSFNLTREARDADSFYIINPKAKK